MSGISKIGALTLALGLAGASAALAGETERVSVDSLGNQGNSLSRVFPARSISADGRFVAFSSSASNLVAGDTNGDPDVFVHDRWTGTTKQVSVATDGAEADGFGSVISADGRFVAFYSQASNLVAGDTNGELDVFVHDRTPSQPNVAPTVTAITAPVDPVPINTAITASVAFSDPDVADMHTVLWDWGNGATSSSGGSSPITATYAYTTPGIYTVTATVTDQHGDSDAGSFEFVVAYDPNGGFVTGVGRIHSPLGAYVPVGNLTGPATFGFASKYQKGTTVPIGNTEFKFQTAGLSFRSTDYQWLVVSGPQSKFKGHGTLNASNGYGFLLYATDGQVSGGGGTDRFRIKIRDASDAVVYDNELGAAEDANPTTAIQGGSIMIHSGRR